MPFIVYPNQGSGSGGSSDVLSVNGKKGNVILNYRDVGAVANIMNTCGGIQIGTLGNRPATANSNVLYVVIDKIPNEFYRFNSVINAWEQIGSSNEDKDIIALEVVFVNTGTGLTSTNLQDVVVELNNIIKDNDTDIRQIVEASKGKVQLNSGDTLNYLEAKIDNSTIVVQNEKLVVKTMSGLEASIVELNYSKGLTENIQEQINRLSRIGNFTGAVNTKNDLSNISSPSVNDMVIVISDESKGGVTTIYMYDGTDWIFIGDFNVEIRDFTTDPIKLGNEVTGILPESNIDPSIARKSDIKNINTTDDLQEGVNNLYYTEARVDNNSNVRANTLAKHIHANKENVLDRLDVSPDGRLMFDNKLVSSGDGGSTDWGDF